MSFLVESDSLVSGDATLKSTAKGGFAARREKMRVSTISGWPVGQQNEPKLFKIVTVD